MPGESDSVLIARAKEEPEAFGLLYERYVDRIYNYVYYRVGNHQDAEDLTARTFYRALKHIARYQDRGAPFEAYLYRIAHNLVANWYRDNERRQFSFYDQVTVSAPERDEPAAVAEMKDERETMLQAIRRLPPERQQLIVLKFVEKMSNADIAQVMERTEGAIKSLYYRTLAELRGELVREHVVGRTDDE